jgi:acetyl-CoA carboxylase biotin carboxylase subunit
VPFAETEARAMSEKLAAIFAKSDYQSLGTIEMLMDRDKNFYFLEVNTRLQVEHSVTEAITSLDLVEMQLKLARGETLATILPQVPPPYGHAIEARIYAEDPVRFLPSPGKLNTFRPPAQEKGLVIDCGYAEGDTVTPFYDPMLALMIAHGKDRAEAIAKLDAALSEFEISGVKTNIPFLRKMLRSEEFVTGRHHTTFAEAFAKT